MSCLRSPPAAIAMPHPQLDVSHQWCALMLFQDTHIQQLTCDATTHYMHSLPCCLTAYKVPGCMILPGCLFSYTLVGYHQYNQNSSGTFLTSCTLSPANVRPGLLNDDTTHSAPETQQLSTCCSNTMNKAAWSVATIYLLSVALPYTENCPIQATLLLPQVASHSSSAWCLLHVWARRRFFYTNVSHYPRYTL